MERLRILRGARRVAKEAYNAARKAGKDAAEAKALGKTAAKDFYAKHRSLNEITSHLRVTIC